MDVETPLAILSLAFGLGLLHALDADHVMAVTALASGRPRLRVCLSFASRWAAGHAASLFSIAILMLVVGLRIPPELAQLAEWLVAAILVGMGTAILYGVARRELRLELHQHPGRPPHLHWQGAEPEAVSLARITPDHKHSAVFIGALHGLAGSAPLLALIPAVAGGSPVWALGYIALFSVGVVIAMVICVSSVGWRAACSRTAPRMPNAGSAL